MWLPNKIIGLVTAFFLMPTTVLSADFLLLPSLSWQQLTSNTEPNESLSEAKLDIFYTKHSTHLSFLAEFLLSTEERELERLELGWHITPQATLWMGRFHNPISIWATNYHHGSYMQTAISNPNAVAWEDDGGLFSTHITGLRLQYEAYPGDAMVRTAFASGLGPQATDDLLFSPFNFLDPSSDQGTASTASLGFYPDATSDNMFGIAINRNEVSAGEILTSDLDQTVAALQQSWSISDWKISSELFFINAEIAERSDNLYSWYYQLEYIFGDGMTLYARQERNENFAADSYLYLLTDFNKSSDFLGFRFDFMDHHAAKVEIGQLTTLNNQDHRFISVEWSMEWSQK